MLYNITGIKKMQNSTKEDGLAPLQKVNYPGQVANQKKRIACQAKVRELMKSRNGKTSFTGIDYSN